MDNPQRSRQYLRIAAFGVLSLCLHLATIMLLDRRAPHRLSGNAAAIHVTLVGQAAPALPVAPQPLSAPAPATRGIALPMPARPIMLGASMIGHGDAQATVQMPGRYRVRPPPSAEIEYQVTHRGTDGKSAPGVPATLAWSSGPQSYELDLSDGAHRWHSEGAVDDAGVAPISATDDDAGNKAHTVFDRSGNRIVFDAGQPDARIVQGSQDRVSLLMQLAGIGLADPDQLSSPLEFYVAGARNAGIVRFLAAGPETLSGPLGVLSTWHLSEQAPAGAGRIEVWLAPAHGWLPVQVRTTLPDRASVTMLARRISPR